MAKVLVRIDRNGTKIYSDDTCSKCGGRGYIHGYEHVAGGVCFRCEGSGIDPRPTITKEYTPEYKAKLEQKRVEKCKKNASNFNFTKLQELGFTQGSTYIVLGNTYAIKDDLKALGAKYNKALGWHFDVLVDRPEFAVQRLDAEKLFDKNEYGEYVCSEEYLHDVVKELQNKFTEENNRNFNPSVFIGTIGDRITLNNITGKLVTTYFDPRYGDSYLYSFTDETQNVFIWKTGRVISSRKLKSMDIKGTIKEHNEFRGVKQTVLTRCQVLT